MKLGRCKVGNLVGRWCNQSGSWTTQCFLTDNLGNTRVVFKIVNGVAKVLSVSHYYAYGMEISDLAQESGESTPYPRLRTTGKETEEQESLYWLDFGPRRYDALLCRWSGPDPLAEAGYSTSPYAYCNGLPTALVDPSGLQAQCYRDDMEIYRRSGGYTGPTYDWSWGESGYYPDREGNMRWMSSDPRSNPAVSLGQVIGRGREWTTIKQ